MAGPITLLTSNFPPSVGGIASMLYDVANSFPAERIAVIGLPVAGWQAFDAQQQFATKRLPVPAGWDTFSPQYKFLAPIYYRELAQRPNTSYVLCCAAHHTLVLPAMLMHARKGTPYGIIAYGADLLRSQQRPYRTLFNRMIRSAQSVFVISRYTRDTAINIGVEPAKIHVINPPLAAGRLAQNVSPEFVQNRFSLHGKRCILTVGSLVERKGHDVLIRALPQILTEVPEAHYIVAGSGPQEGYLRNLVRELQLGSHVTFAGFVPVYELGSYYAASEVFAMISREIPEKGDVEGFGIVYLEANLFGKPVVAGRSGGVQDAVYEGLTGLLVDPHSTTEVAHAIVRLLRDPELAKRLGETGRIRVLTEFSAKAAAEKLLGLLPS